MSEIEPRLTLWPVVCIVYDPVTRHDPTLQLNVLNSKYLVSSLIGSKGENIRNKTIHENFGCGLGSEFLHSVLYKSK